MFTILKYIQSIETKHTGPWLPPWLQMRKLKFITSWLENKSNQIKSEHQNQFKDYFKLENFTTKQLLNEVFQSNIFSQDEIFLAIENINEKLLAENRKLKLKIDFIKP